jgi:hypothetical protein
MGGVDKDLLPYRGKRLVEHALQNIIPRSTRSLSAQIATSMTTRLWAIRSLLTTAAILIARSPVLRNEKEQKNGPLWRFCSRDTFYRADSWPAFLTMITDAGTGRVFVSAALERKA